MTLGKPSGKRVINCSGTEARLIDCPFEMLPSSETCSYLLVECNGTLQPTVGPTAAATKVLHTPVSTVSATSLAGTTFTVPAVVSSPDISAPQSTSVDGPPIAILATATSLVVAITAIGVTLLFSLIIYIRWKRSTLKQQTERCGCDCSCRKFLFSFSQWRTSVESCIWWSHHCEIKEVGVGIMQQMFLDGNIVAIYTMPHMHHLTCGLSISSEGGETDTQETEERY